MTKPLGHNRVALDVFSATLSLSKVGQTIDFAEIAQGAGTTEEVARETLLNAIGFGEEGSCLSEDHRLRLAMQIAKSGKLGAAAKMLTWQEFEKFGEKCLEEAEFRTERNVRVNGDGRAWQIDLVGYRGELILAIDCKHWTGSNFESRFGPPAQHQRIATAHFLKALMKKTTGHENNYQGLAVILTLLEPPTRFLESAAIVSIQRLSTFLNEVTPFDRSLPLISASDLLVENPMSQSNSPSDK